MKVHTVGRQYWIVAILLASIGNVYSQQASSPHTAQRASQQKAVSYSFVSPNTRENLTLDEAVKLLNSPEETQLVASIHSLSRCLGLRPLVSRSVGSWVDGAEHSTVFRVYADEHSLLYQAARLGKMQRQKTVLYFRQSVPGGGRMYILYPRIKRSLSWISRKLDEIGIDFRALVPRWNRPTIVYVVDLENKLRTRMISAAHKLRARLVRIKGTGAFIGNDTDRGAAQSVFADTIKNYEAGNPEVARKCSP